ncbi:MAG: cytochrome c3 family protein [Desulfovibrio sp.]
MKQLLILSLLALFLAVPIAFASNSVAQEEFTAPDDDLLINKIKGNSPRDIGVIFNHSSHGDYDCVECHHRWKGDKAPVSCANGSKCHNELEPNELRSPKSFFKAMHKKNTRHQSCVQCHTEIAEGDKDMTGCTRSMCHTEGLY